MTNILNKITPAVKYCTAITICTGDVCGRVGKYYGLCHYHNPNKTSNPKVFPAAATSAVSKLDEQINAPTRPKPTPVAVPNSYQNKVAPAGGRRKTKRGKTKRGKTKRGKTKRGKTIKRRR
jgi:hypothetical protein